MTENIFDMEYQKFVTTGAVTGIGSNAIACVLVGMSGTAYIPIQVTGDGRLITVSGA